MSRAGRGEWPERRPAPPDRFLLDDASTSEPHLPELFEQNRIAGELLRTVDSFLHRKAASRNQGPKNLFLALHGRFGQGKSGVIEQLRRDIDLKIISGRKKLVPARILNFNCANYAPEDLLYNFDHFIEGARLRLLLIIATSLAVAVFFLTQNLSLISGLEFLAQQQLLLSVLSFLALSFGSLRHVVRDVWRSLRLGNPLSQVLYTAADRIIMRPDMLIIDDLDRASTEQQEAVLKSLNRHRLDFEGVVLVVFDDSPILEAAQTQQQIQEFLTKVFDASFRLAPMNARDAGEMGSSFAMELAQRNPDCRVAQTFTHPSICGDLARVFMLHGNASARFAKKLVNNVYCSACVGNFRSPTDLSALIRLHGIFEYVPVMETQLDFIADALIDKSEPELVAYVEERFGAALGRLQKSRLINFLQHTRHMQPTSLAWMRLLRIWRNPVSLVESKPPPSTWHTRWTRNWAMNDAFLATLNDGPERLRCYQTLARFPGVPHGTQELKPPAGTIEEQFQRPPGVQDARWWQGMIDRVHVFDGEVLKLQSPSEIDHVIARHREHPVGLLAYSRSGELTFGNVRSAFRHSLHSPDTFFADRIRHELIVHIASTGELHHAPEIELPERIREIRPSVLDEAWPDFAHSSEPGTFSPEVERHFCALSDLLPDFSREAKILPDAHKLWISRALSHHLHSDVYKALETVLQSSLNGKHPHWPKGLIQTFWSHFAGQGFEGYLAKIAIAARSDLIALWSISLHQDIETQVLPELEKCGLSEQVLPDAVDVELPTPPWYDDLWELAEVWPVLEAELVAWDARWKPTNRR
ncbi:MAG: P-loop NTPase fold protein [Pseudomonadota bacterium]